jgi:hypothetical protein
VSVSSTLFRGHHGETRPTAVGSSVGAAVGSSVGAAVGDCRCQVITSETENHRASSLVKAFALLKILKASSGSKSERGYISL